ncbi:alpha/beta fold hydrolase [Nocardioides jiangxiensis]|uniref:Alpha/beta fold hydrolase n=1 Tax=Nocardioides jiangxiensis TaxID=3064524 RepID=A0ABT9AY18_9ACTN|nr:alpha/beta fold hydrolase [Nocardioides sp. WY-20]MDO7867295.1 alpha/beta fold hydrolase [Nocardioides sp. WY-20]
MPLHTTSYGDSGSRVVFCHGLFGQGRNWTQHARALAERHRVLLVDMPNHGRSPWSDRMDYLWMADQVAELLDPSDPVALVGHSMGAKAAMVLTLRRPELVERLMVVDMAPVAYGNGSGFRGYIDAMLALDLPSDASREQADAALRDAVPDTGVRSFLLQNLRRTPEGWSWQPNLELLREELGTISGWPAEELAGLPPYDGPVLWVGGADSGYVKDEYAPAMEALFPRVRKVMIKGAGHWVHSEQPQVFREVLTRFVG